MNEFIFGFSTGLSFILAIGAQNLFVMEQGIKKNHIFLVTTICAISDFLLIFLGIFIFYSIQSFLNSETTLILNILLICFLLYFIWGKIKNFRENLEIPEQKQKSKSIVIAQTLGFTFLNPHVYSDTCIYVGKFIKVPSVFSPEDCLWIRGEFSIYSFFL
jgi:L-lysine exporter family protein LysE/ArgO